MASSEKFCLRWNDFESNISVAFRELREDKDFFDVTLACEDNQLSAHKVILSACSPFFRNILRRNPHQHPLLYLRGVKHSDLQSVLNFMYHGEVNVAQEELNSFLAVAEDLKVKGLTQNSSSSATKRARSPAPQITRPPVEREPIKRARPTPAPAPAPPGSYSSVGNDDDDIQEVVESVKQEPREAPVTVLQDNSLVQQQQQSIPQQMTEDDQALAQYSGYDEDYGQYDEPVMEHYDQSAMVGESSESNKASAQFSSPEDLLQFVLRDDMGKGYLCGICQVFRNSSKSHVRDHVEQRHYPNTFDYSCQLCGKMCSSKISLRDHNKYNHK